MSTNTEREILDKVINLIKKNKAQGDVILSKNNTFNLKAHLGEMDKYEVSNTATIGVRVIKDNRVGISFSEAFDDDSIKFMVNEALTNSRFSKENIHEKITTKKGEIVNDFITEKKVVDPKELIDLCLKNERLIREKDSRIKSSPYNGVREVENHLFLLTTTERYCETKKKFYVVNSSSLMEDGKKNSSYYDYTITKKFSDLDYKKSTEECFEHTKNILTAKEIPTGHYNILFSNKIVADMFNTYMGIFSGEKTVRGLNPLKDKLGQKIASESLTIIDSPNFKDALNEYTFDDEGNSVHEITLLENGVMKNLIHNGATASELKMENNFRASRSPKSSLGVTNFNIIIKEGKTPDSDIEKFDHLEIIDVQGMHSGSNFFSGEFSCAAKGYVWKNGVRAETFKNVTLSGNFYDMLKNIEAIGNKAHANSFKNFFAPKIIFKNLSISGT